MAKSKTVAIRLALRHEGDFWNAYLAHANTMRDAKLIGSIMIGAVARNSQAKQTFMELMQSILADAAEVVTGERPSHFKVDRAPESERSGHG